MFHRTKIDTRHTPIQIATPDVASVFHHGEKYWIWRGMCSSYNSLQQERTHKKNNIRLSYLKWQIVSHYFKNFFLFPIWFVRFLMPSYMKGDVTLWTNL